jgi:hypothetical protein
MSHEKNIPLTMECRYMSIQIGFLDETTFIRPIASLKKPFPETFKYHL